MSNLGGYQIMTTVAKKVGGPLIYTALTALTGYAVIRTGEAGVKTILKKGKQNRQNKHYANSIFTVNKNNTDKQGLEFKKGDQFRVLEYDGDSILIEIIGNSKNPFFVSGNYLKSISDFK